MQRVEPRQVEPDAQSQDQAGPGKQWALPTGFASTGSQTHTQSFEEIYGVPENFLEIEVHPMCYCTLAKSSTAVVHP